MNVSGTDTRLWINARERQDGTVWHDYSVGISKKTETGDYINTYMKVRFAKSVNVPADLPNGVKMDYEGFVTVDSYTDKNGNEVRKPMAMITQASFESDPVRAETVRYTDEQIAGFSASSDEIPF